MATTARPGYPPDTTYRDDGYRRTAPAAVRRISWGAIAAGVVVVLVVQMALMLLGLAIGTATIDPVAADTPQASTLGIGGGVWWLAATAISVFFGAWVAGPARRHADRDGRHAARRGHLGGRHPVRDLPAHHHHRRLGRRRLRRLGSAAQAVGQGTQSLASTAMQALPDDIRNQAQGLFDRAPAAAGQVQQEAQQTQQAAGAGSPVDAVQRVVRGVQDGASQQDRDAALNVISQQAGIPREEAERRLGEFQATYRDYSQQAAEQARQAAQAAAETVSQVSFWSVVALVIGAALAAVGGRLGTPRDLRAAI